MAGVAGLDRTLGPAPLRAMTVKLQACPLVTAADDARKGRAVAVRPDPPGLAVTM